MALRLPFCVDVCKKTFEHLDALLRRVSEDLTGAADWPPPPQEKECIAVATLNLLRLQVPTGLLGRDADKKKYIRLTERFSYGWMFAAQPVHISNTGKIAIRMTASVSNWNTMSRTLATIMLCDT